MQSSTHSFHRSLSLLVCLSILAVLAFTGCSRGDEPTAVSTNPPKPTATNIPPTNPPKPSPTNAPPASTPNPIQNIIWQWVSVTDRSTGDTITVPDPSKYTIAFFPDNTLSGTADCNTFSGTYSQKNGFTITIGASTKAYCGDDSLDQQYLDLLNKVVAGGPDGSGGLALENAGGEKRLLFRNGGTTVKP